jgi:hypothetical protein
LTKTKPPGLWPGGFTPTQMSVAGDYHIVE